MTQATVDDVVARNAQSKNTAEFHTPTLISPPDTRTPPTATHQRQQPNDAETRYDEREPSAIDPNVLSNALKKFEDNGRQRELTPGGSPSRKRQRTNWDR